MIYLFLAVLCSSGIALLLKWAGKKAKSQAFVLSGNYFSASTAALIAFNLSPAMLSGAGFPAGFDKLAWLGLALGILLYTTFYLFQKSIIEKGVSISGAFARMGVLIPLVVSMVIWREYPSQVQSVGIMIILAALAYYYLPGKSAQNQNGSGVILLLLMLASGLTDFMTKVYQKGFDVQYKELFLLIGFGTALIISLYFAFKKTAFSWKDFGIGMIIGIPNVLSAYFIILALERMIAAVVFPVYSAGTLAFIIMGGMVFFREQLQKREWVTMAGILAAVVFINANFGA